MAANDWQAQGDKIAFVLRVWWESKPSVLFGGGISVFLY